MVRYFFILAILVINYSLVFGQNGFFDSTNYPNIGFVEYTSTFKSFNNNTPRVRNYKFWYVSNNLSGSISQFILSDSLETIVFRDNKLIHFMHDRKEKFIDTITDKRAYNLYQNHISTPHLSRGRVILKCLNGGNYKMISENFHTKFSINMKLSDTNYINKFLVVIEFNSDSTLINYSLKYHKPNHDSSLMIYNYIKALPVTPILINNTSDTFTEKYFYYQRIYSKAEISNKKSITTYQLPDSILTINSVKNSLLDSSVKIIMVDFWYLSCAPCRKSMPFLNTLYEKYSSQGLKIISINYYDTTTQSINNLINKFEIKYQVALKSKNLIFETFPIKIFPSILFFDKNGKFLFLEEGYSIEAEKKIEDQIIKILN